MHTFKFHLTEGMLMRAYDAIRQKTRDEQSHKMYALEVTAELPFEVPVLNTRMKVVEHPLSALVPTAEIDTIQTGEATEIESSYLKELSEVEFKKLMYGTWIDEQERGKA